jgi:molybdopterin-guanine dinucleotide biosynthesis protein A
VSRGDADPIDGATPDVTGVLLVGGASRRFGSRKALAEFDGETLAQRAWEALAWCNERLVVGKVDDGLPLPFSVHDDSSSVRAPLAGLVAGLRLAANELIVALPVDCPLVTPEILKQLAAACADAAVPQTGPLPGAYRRSALPLLARRLTNGELALRDALPSLEVRVVQLDAGVLANVNTPEDLRTLQAQR